MRIYDFVREHVIPFNSVIAMAITVAAVLDFLAPQAPYLAWLSYVLAAMVLLAMVLEVRAQRPGVAGGAWYVRLLGRLRAPPGPLWKSPAWQVIGIIAAIALVLGQASKARAYSGGLIASAAPNLRNVQLLLLDLKEDARRMQAVLDGVDTKVDSIHASMGNMEAALTKDPLEALMEGDYPFLKKHVEAGKRLPRDVGTLLRGLNQKRDDRIDLIRLYMAHEFDIREPVPVASIASSLTDDVTTLRSIKKLNARAEKLLNLDGSSAAKAGAYMFLDACPTMDLLAYAYIAGDQPLADWLIQQGLNPNAQYPCVRGWVEPRTRWKVSAKELRALTAPQ